jgi:CRISPR-associated exonuclease Cas4
MRSKVDEMEATVSGVTREAEEWYLQVTDLKQFDYCPRIVYYHYCLPAVRPTTYKMEAGIAAQDRVTSLEKRRKLSEYEVVEGIRHFNVSVQSERLGVSGQIDLVVETGEGADRRLVPVDFKLSRRKPGSHFRLQLACYALLLEECWAAPVTVGYVHLIQTRESIAVEMTTRLRREAERKLKEIRSMIRQECIPEPVKQRSRCVNCEFRRFCNDVL